MSEFSGQLNLDEKETAPEETSQEDTTPQVTQEETPPPTVDDSGHLVDAEGNKVFTTVEEAIKDGSMELDSKGRMPGVYLDDVEEAQRLAHEEKMNEALGAAKSAVNSPVERQVSVVNSPIPPVTVTSRQETPVVDAAPKEDEATTEA